MKPGSGSKVGPKPWPGCDRSGRAWIAYCEAWEHCFTRKDPRIKANLDLVRGPGSVATLDHNMRVVRADYAGDIEDRTTLPKLLRL